MNKYLLAFLLLFSFLLSHSQVLINEYSASNLDDIKDSFGKTEDWIELFNTELIDIDISGWYISDKEDDLEKWQFPSGTIIRAQGYMTIFCSGKDGFYFDEYHSNFKLTQTEGDDIIVLSNSQGDIIDRSDLNLTLTEHSNCRAIDGGEIWRICTEPTFGASNNDSPQATKYAAQPSMTLIAGFYNGDQIVTLVNNEENSLLRYTLDGSNPLNSSPIYSSPISITSTTVVKAKAYSNDPDILPGKIEFRTFFIDESFSLPVYSVAADRVTNLANGTGVLLPIGSLEYFRDTKLEAASFGELNRHGQDSWVLDHRSIDWISRDEMGYSKAVNAPMFSSSDRDSYQRFMFRNSGDDNYPAIDDGVHNGSAHLRDEYVQTLAQEGQMELDVRKSERVIVFLNGQYWGVYGMREKVVDHDYTSEYYNQGKEDLQFLSTWGTTDVEYGGPHAMNDWISLRDFILENDMSDPSNYEKVEDSLNMVSLIDYFTMNQVTVAVDWLNYNTGWWRGLSPDGSHKKWGYILWDLDATFDYYINYTGVPDRSAEASMCDIYDVSESMDQFFESAGGSFSICEYFDGNNSPYSDDDPIFNYIVSVEPGCCSDWTSECQEYYDNPSTIPDPSEDLSSCPSIISGSSPYPANDSIFIAVVEADPFCCSEWDNFCQILYNDFISGPIDISECAIFDDNDFPYSPSDPALVELITFVPFCCNNWTNQCQQYYNFIKNDFGPDISQCPIVTSASSPYPPDDPKLPFVVQMNPPCCEKWRESCQRDYDLLGGDQFAEPGDPLTTDLLGNLGKHEKILLKLFQESPQFKQLYYSRYADLMNTVYTCENMIDLLDRMIAEIAPEMPGQIDRWGGSMAEWESNIDDLRSFINDRCRFISDEALACHNEVEGQFDVTLMTQPEGIGRIEFNTLSHTLFPWTGGYYGNMDNLAKASVLDEYKNKYLFSHWESKMGNHISPSDMDQDITYRLSMPDTLIAHFKEVSTNSGGRKPIVINEFMASNDETVTDQDGEYDDWIELHNKGYRNANLSGYFLTDNAQNLTKYEIPENALIPAKGYLIIWADEDEDQDGLHANFKLSRSGETIFLVNKDTSVVDQIAYEDQETDISFARKPNGTGDFEKSAPTFNASNDIANRDIAKRENLIDGEIQKSSNLKFRDDQLIVFPNPTSNTVTIQLKENGFKLLDVVVSDALGKIVDKHNNVNDYQMIIAVDHLPSGIYFITANKLYTSKLIKK